MAVRNVTSTDRPSRRSTSTTASSTSSSLVDAHVVASAMERGGGVCLTADVADLERLAAGVPGVSVVAIGPG
jgi:hypothetical protein